MRTVFGLALALALLSSCRPDPPKAITGVEILDGSQIPAMLRQCSRSTPAPGEGSWQPSSSDILALERALPPVLKARWPELDWSSFPGKWGRRYVGIVRHGRHYIYGNYSPHGEGDVCDGGPYFFGAEFDVAARKISHLAFNGQG